MNFEDFSKFTDTCPKFIYKPLEGGQGEGIQVFDNIPRGVFQMSIIP